MVTAQAPTTHPAPDDQAETWFEALRQSDLGQLVSTQTAWLLELVAIPMFVYFLLINSSYLLLIVMATLDFSSSIRRRPYAGYDDAATSPLTQPVSLVMPAYREEVGIVASVRTMLALRYPEFELVVVVDGDPDPTLDVLIDAFDLIEVPCHAEEEVFVAEHARRLYLPSDGRTPLRVVVKKNSGRADSANVGINFARYPLVALVDADSILDPDALLMVSKPFADDPERVVATGGAVRVVNGCRVVGGRVVDVRMPGGWLARIQVVEYLRAFMLGRAGFSRMRSLILISGAFGLFRRDVMVAVGGLNHRSIGEDFDLVMRIHREMRRRRADYRLVYVPEATLWTEVPVTLRVLGNQRRRWHRGLWEVLVETRDMVLKPRYGRVGAAALPFYWLFELIAPLLELGGAGAVRDRVHVRPRGHLVRDHVHARRLCLRDARLDGGGGR